jgi:hypothetical protein
MSVVVLPQAADEFQDGWTAYQNMRIAIIAGCLFSLFVPGCAHRQEKAQTPPPAQVTTISRDGYTWSVGAVKIDGTNVPAGAVQVRPRTGEEQR